MATKQIKSKFDPPNLDGEARIVFDVEGTGVDVKKDVPVGYVVSWGPRPDQTRYYPTAHTGGGNCDKDKVVKWFQRLAKSPNLKEVIGAHVKYDLHMAHKDGIDFSGKKIIDVAVNAALIDENAGRYNLGDIADRCRVQAKKGDELYKKMAEMFGGEPDRKSQIGNLHKMPGWDPLVCEYAEGDGTTTWQVEDFQMGEINHQNLIPVWELECAVLPVLWGMEHRGVPIDEDRLHWLKDEMERRLHAAEEKLPTGFNVRSGPQISDFLRSKGVTGFLRTARSQKFPEGQESFTAAWLEDVPEGRPIIEVRKLSNLLNSFIDPMIERHLFNGRVHTTFNQLKMDEYGTVTGRLSSSDPNEQQVPKRDTILAPLFRSTHVPEKGHQWSSNDYSQQEFRVFADYSGSPLLINGYKADPPVDIHTVVAQLLTVDRDPTAKRMNLGMLYGMGTAKLARSINVTEEQAVRYKRTYDGMIPEARKFLREAESWAIKRGWVRTKMWRRRHFPDRRFAHKAGNAIIQGTSADMTKLKMVEIDDLFRRHGAESHLLLQVHDELCWSVAPGEEELDREARRIMESFGPDDRIQFDVPMKVEGNVAKNWDKASFTVRHSSSHNAAGPKQ